MNFEEAKALLLAEEEARRAQWATERTERLARGEGNDLDHLFAGPMHVPNVIDRVWWRVRRFVRDQIWRHHWTYRIRDFWQRGRRGWSDNDWWNLNNHLEEILPQMLRRLASGSHGYPIDIYDETGKSMVFDETIDDGTTGFLRNLAVLELDDDEVDPRSELWKVTLERMAIGFDAMRVLEENGWRHDSEAEHELERMFREGFMLMYHNWASLWD